MSDSSISVAQAFLAKDFWARRRVFVTGHTGFKGAWLSVWLRRFGADVTGYSLEPPTQPNLFELARIANGLRSVLADVRDLNRLKSAMAEAQPEFVFHLAAQSLVRQSYLDPAATYAVNVLGTVNVLEAIRQTQSVEAALIVTTDKCYANREWIWGYRERDRLGGHDPYSSSKACAELVTQAFRDSFFAYRAGSGRRVAIASARAGNVIGGGDWASDRIIPDFVRAVLDKRPLRVRHPDAVRPWQHVLDPLHGYLGLAQRLLQEGAKWAEGWNFGPVMRDARDVRWVVERFAHLWGDDARWHSDPAGHPHETATLRLDISKASQRMRWEPIWDVEQALEQTVAWYRKYANGEDPFALTLGQIEQFEREAGVLEHGQ